MLAPVWWLAFHGARKAPFIAWLPLFCTLDLIALGQADWDGSFSPPARLIVAALPRAAPMLAHAWSETRKGSGVAITWTALLALFAVAQTIAALSNPTLAWTDSVNQIPTLLGRGLSGWLPNWDEGASFAAAGLRTLPLLALGVATVMLTRPRHPAPDGDVTAQPPS